MSAREVQIVDDPVDRGLDLLRIIEQEQGIGLALFFLVDGQQNGVFVGAVDFLAGVKRAGASLAADQKNAPAP